MSQVRSAVSFFTISSDGASTMTSTPSFYRMYDFKDTLGKGHFSVVKLAEVRATRIANNFLAVVRLLL